MSDYSTTIESRKPSTKDAEGQNVLEALREGSHTAYKKIYLQWRKPIFGLLYKLTGSQEEADDITQDVFIKLWEIKETIDPEKNIQALLYVIARNSAFKYFKRRKARENYVSSPDISEIDTVTSYEIIVSKETELLKELAINRMPKQRKLIYELSINDGLSTEQIAQQLNIRKETVYNQLSIARKELRDVLAVFMLLMMS